MVELVEHPVFCMEHCKNHKLFSFGVPKACSNCGTELATADLIIPPFRIPSPFHNVVETPVPCALLLKPTVGDFLTNYSNGDNLHIGITSSIGIIYEFDHTGLQISYKGNSWTRCLVISMSGKYGPKCGVDELRWQHRWDVELEEVALSQQHRWPKETYHHINHNCYTFVLAVLQSLGIDELSDVATEPGTFCEKFILPKTTSAAKYIPLYRKLFDENSQ